MGIKWDHSFLCHWLVKLVPGVFKHFFYQTLFLPFLTLYCIKSLKSVHDTSSPRNDCTSLTLLEYETSKKWSKANTGSKPKLNVNIYASKYPYLIPYFNWPWSVKVAMTQILSLRRFQYVCFQMTIRSIWCLICKLRTMMAFCCWRSTEV